jgi:hypothetical protein
MLDVLKRLFARRSAPAATPAWDDVSRWAGERQAQFRAVREDGGGLVVDGRCQAIQWRLEWGPSQRPYVQGSELRLRAELPLPGDVHALVLDRTLQAAMEKAVFDQYVEGVQTRIDNQTPPEMRWLVMFPKLAHQDLGALRDRFVAVAPGRGWVVEWLGAGLTDALLAAPLVPEQPFVLMVSRARMTLRTALATPTPALLEGWVRVFEAALRCAPRSVSADSGLGQTQPSHFTTSALPEDERRR